MKNKDKLPYPLGLIGGGITIVVAFLLLILSWNILPANKIRLGIIIWAFCVGALTITFTYLTKTKSQIVFPILTLIINLFGTITLQGLIIGPVLGIISGVISISLLRKKK